MFGNGYFNPGSTGGSGTPAGINREVQINNAGAFGAVTNFDIDGGGTVGIPNIISSQLLHNSGLENPNRQQILSGVYTPNVSATVNISTVPAASPCNYLRVGNIVTVSGIVVNVDATLAAATSFKIDLPIVTTGAGQSDISGTGSNGTIDACAVSCDGTGLALFNWTAADLTAGDWRFTFTYVIN